MGQISLIESILFGALALGLAAILFSLGWMMGRDFEARQVYRRWKDSR